MSAPRPNLLLVEDDPQIQRFLATALDAHGYALRIAGSGNEGLQLAALHQPDIAIVDIGLPDISGLDLIARLREWYAQPILVLSAREREADKVAALDLGADDYLTKPFGIGELLARLRVMQRHLAGREAAGESPRIEIGDITLDLAARRVLRGDEDVHLTPIEYQLLATLARHRGKVLTHRQLLREVWGAAHTESPQYLRIYMRSLRKKIETDPARPRWLTTEVGVGYRLADGEERI
ncbi:response regulator [Dokdonella sp.]|uniref:response regulator n=1 Tax=Dokdonella sp. TaxID=2291710 RepID=UPI001B281CAB|nr:response regulator [Dokdonella sp.]MBO9664144.1 response regulator [Dokdonella sp.]